ncbi:hypothetical protein KXR53_34520 [Inquilinus limosus]|uniref:hypothetical protein n=1 Tax=Inquilinus limosus TaxID=171674 RepID=UPI003F180BF5
MAEAAEVLLFSIFGKAEAPSDRTLTQRMSELFRAQVARSGSSSASEEQPPPVKRLNEKANDLAREIEREMLAMMPPDPFLSVQAEIRFRSGSLVMLGTLAILSWSGSIVLDAVRAQLTEVVKIAVQRVVSAAIAAVAPALPPMQCSVSSRSAAAEPTPAAPSWRETRRPGWRDLVLVLLAVAVVVLLLDRFVVITLREPAPQTTAAITK